MTIACYSILLIALCHYKVVFYIEVWCYPYPPDYQRITQNDFSFRAPMPFFNNLQNVLPFFYIFINTICVLLYRTNTTDSG